MAETAMREISATAASEIQTSISGFFTALGSRHHQRWLRQLRCGGAFGSHWRELGTGAVASRYDPRVRGG
ncbi:hypothetical protein I553_5530 [Mycobacterium xenopi 4042]|uniref:Uncharacterized protein n=1 Tax=Mycobacterium xenopi 4042 TaxID=1299334 RepID=X7ZX09_MYCXE|nr:hypothetical protein I553_5530 [Mycobacterium xenopi 4042]EUA51937.1 hypothetical protein I552_2884 [Mycobacterium xenopi 3993]